MNHPYKFHIFNNIVSNNYNNLKLNEDNKDLFHQIFIDACFKGNINKINKLIDKININITDDDGRTALHLAAIEGRINIVKLLLEKGANLIVKIDGIIHLMMKLIKWKTKIIII
jgi:glutaminase